jgi:hypothetical protein
MMVYLVVIPINLQFTKESFPKLKKGRLCTQAVVIAERSP